MSSKENCCEWMVFSSLPIHVIPKQSQFVFHKISRLMDLGNIADRIYILSLH